MTRTSASATLPLFIRWACVFVVVLGGLVGCDDGDVPGAVQDLPRDTALQDRASKSDVGHQQPDTAVDLTDAANLRKDVRNRRAQFVARHGPVEWLAQVQMNELHRHLGPTPSSA